MALEAVCEDMGWDMVGPATRAEVAMEMAKNEEFDVALLDVNLNGVMSWGVASILAARGIPFGFATGYDIASILPPEFSDRPIFSKPFDMSEVERQILQLLAPAQTN